MLILLLFLICFYGLLLGKDPPPGLFPRDCIPKSGPHEKPKKPPEKHKNKNNITSRKAAKSDLLPAVFGARCFQDPWTIAAGTPCPIRFSGVKRESDVNRGWPGRGGEKEINQNKSRARTRMRKNLRVGVCTRKKIYANIMMVVISFEIVVWR